MVFGWGKKKQEQIDEHEPKTGAGEELKLDEINPILLEKKNQLQNEIVRKTKPLFEEIKHELDSIHAIISHLKTDDLKVDDIDKTLRAHVVRSKAEVIDVISKESKKTLPNASNYEDVTKTAELAAHILKKIGDVLGKHSRVIHVFAKKYANDLKTHLELITKDHMTISKMISDHNSMESASLAINEKARKVQTTHKEINENVAHLNKLQYSFLELERTIKSTQQQIAELFESAQYEKFMQYRNEINHVVAQESQLNKEIDDEFSKISRPLGKYVYVTSLEKPLKMILEQLVQNPSNTISENKDAVITILESCMKGIMSGSVSVKETDKAIDHVTHIISLLDSFVSKKNSLKSQLQDLQQKLTIFDLTNLETLEKQLAKAKSDSEDAKFKIKKLEDDLKHQMAQKDAMISELEDSLQRLLKTKYVIKLE
jgi:predicted transcriptional regulator YdeE